MIQIVPPIPVNMIIRVIQQRDVVCVPKYAHLVHRVVRLPIVMLVLEHHLVQMDVVHIHILSRFYVHMGNVLTVVQQAIHVVILMVVV